MIFLDGIGLGAADPLTNPFAVANTPTLHSLAAGKRWLAHTGRQQGERSLFLPTDPRLGVPGRPQSGTGQATIFTGKNVPGLIGKHYGPKPDKATRDLLARDNLFCQVVARGKSAALLEAYPPGWHRAVESGRRLRSSYQQAAHEAGVPIFGQKHFRAAMRFRSTGRASNGLLHRDTRSCRYAALMRQGYCSSPWRAVMIFRSSPTGPATSSAIAARWQKAWPCLSALTR